MAYDADTRLETAFDQIVSAGSSHALDALEMLGRTDPLLRTRLDPLVQKYLLRQRRRPRHPAVPFLDPSTLPSRFRITRLLGSGGFGHVFHAVDTRYEAEVALKVLHSRQSSSFRRFKDEFTMLSAVASHDNLVSLYEGFFEDEPWMFSMEYVDGVDLLTYVQGSTADSRTQQIRSCLGQLANGVQALHLHKCHHRDLKPSNVLVTRTGKVKVIDFGLVREFGDRFEESASLVGTLAYMSPEQLTRRTVSEASDWYAAGVMLYELLTGTKPHASAFFSSDSGSLVPPDQIAAGLPDDLNSLCLRLLATDPRVRASYADIAAVAWLPESIVVAPRQEVTCVGRESERNRFADYFAQSHTHPVVVHLLSPSGVGKTTLLRQVLADIRGRDRTAVVLAARCHQNQSVPYPALDDLVDRLSRVLSGWSPDLVAQVLPRSFAALARMFPVMEQFRAGAHALPALESTELRLRGFAALGELLGRLAERYSVVLAIDDLQWGDRNGCAFLADLMASQDAPRLMLILSYRSDAGDQASWLAAAPNPVAGKVDRVEHRMLLGLLDEEETSALAEQLLAAPLKGDAQLVRQIAQVSGGNPYLVQEIVAWTNAAGIDRTRLDTISTDQVLRSRIEALGDDSRFLLELVAIASQPTDLDELRATSRFTNVLEARDELRRERLTLSRVLEGREQIEVYHARVRDAVLQMLDPSMQARRHREMARALEASARPDCERIAIHLERAGEVAACGVFARQAGDQAFRALAFEKAVHFYQLAVNAGMSGDERPRVLRNLADALANSGRCAEAARAYADAADFAERREQLELTARAGDQLLRGGHIREGLRILDDVMSRLRLRPPRSRLVLLVRVALLRVRLAVRGLAFEKRGAEQLSEEDRLRLEVCWTGTMVTSLVDPLRSAESSARYVILALRSGDQRHIANALSCEAPLLCLTPSKRSHAKAHRLLDVARRLSEEVGNPNAHARYLLSKALVAFLQGDWRTAAREGDTATEVLRDRCVNVTWELATAQIFASAARFIRGDWAENQLRVPMSVREAESRGASNVAVSLRVQGCAYFSTLAAHQPADALRQLRDDVAAWSYEHADFFRCRVMQAEVDIALYGDDPGSAHDAIERDWAKLNKALLLRNPTTFAFLYFARGRAALAMAAHVPDGPRRRALLSRAESTARALERRGAAWSHGMAMVLRAGVASWGDRDLEVDEHLRQADRALASGDIQPIRMAVSYHLARRTRSASEGWADRAEEWARREGVVRIDRIAAALAPGNYGDAPSVR